MSKKANKTRTKKALSKETPKKAAGNTYSWVISALVVGLIGLISFICYQQMFDHSFTNWDDPVYVTENELIQQPPFENLDRYFKETVSLNYHPITMISLGLNYSSARLESAAYLKTNFYLHLINTLLVFLLMHMIFPKQWIISAAVSFIFALHPMHVESVAWVSERKDVLYVFFLLIAFILYLKAKKSRYWLFYSLSLMAFVASCLSKGMAVIFPVLLILHDVYTSQKWKPKLILDKLPFLMISVGFGITALKIQSQGAINEFETFTLLERVSFAAYGFNMYILKFIAPIELSAFYPYPRTIDSTDSVSIVYYLMPIIAIVLIGLSIFYFKKNRIWLFGLFFFAVAVALVLQFISVGSAIMADRYSYLAYIGLSIPLGYFLNQFWDNKHSLRYPLTICTIIWMAYCVYLTNERIAIWKNTETLWTDVIEKFPERVEVAYKNLGNYYGKQNKLNAALTQYKLLMAMESKDAEVYSNLGNIYGLMGDFKASEEAYDQSIALEPSMDAYFNRAITLSNAGRLDDAKQDYLLALEIEPNNVKVNTNLAFLYLSNNEYREAIELYNQLILTLKDEQLYLNRGLAYFNLTQYHEAIANFEQVAKLDPTNPKAYYNQAICYLRLDNIEEAKRNVIKAQQLGQPVPTSIKQRLGI